MDTLTVLTQTGKLRVAMKPTFSLQAVTLVGKQQPRSGIDLPPVAVPDLMLVLPRLPPGGAERSQVAGEGSFRVLAAGARASCAAVSCCSDVATAPPAPWPPAAS